nr:helicase [Tanacetum cinerariifolium]
MTPHHAYTAFEEQRLKWTKNNQYRLRVDLYHDPCDAVTRRDTSASGLGKRIVLPRTFTGSPSYIMHNYQDAMALCQAYGNLDLFITFTSNPKWPKIAKMLAYLPGQKAHDRPEVGTRVFKLKLTELLNDLAKKHVFGQSEAVVYVIEFQKRGLPHTHILLWLEEHSKCRTPSEIDDIISAELPSPTDDPAEINKWYQSLCSETLIKKILTRRTLYSLKEMDLDSAQNMLLQKNGNSYNPVPRTIANVNGTSTSTIPGLVTIKEKAQKKNDVKGRSMLLMALPNEHLLTLSQYKDAKTLFETIQARFSDNDATKKTQKTLLKQMYENFNAPNTENKADLDTMTIDDLYNNFKIVKQEVKRTVTTSLSYGSQNMAFLSSPGSTNEVDTANIQVSTIITPVSTVSNNDNTANMSDATVYFQKTSKKITINRSDTAGYDKKKVECFNCHKWDTLQGNAKVIGTKKVLIRATWLMMKLQPTWLLWLSQTQRTGVGNASYNAVAPPPTGLFAPPTIDLSNSGLEEFQHPEFEGYRPKASKSVCVDTSNEIKKALDALIIED